MARIVYSALIESIRGSIGGTTFQKNAYGYTIKKKPNMINPNSQPQQLQKTFFALAVRAWGQLTNAQRADWDTWATTYPQYAKHNPTSQLSGFAVFTKVHVYRLMYGRPVDTNPTYTAYAQDIITLGCKLVAGVLSLVVTSDNDSEEWWLVLSVSRPFTDSQNFVGSRVRYMTQITNTTTTVNITTKYTSLFGILPAVGQKIALSVIPYGEANGQVLAREDKVMDVTNA